MWQKMTGTIASAANTVKDTVTSVVPLAKPALSPVTSLASESDGVTSGGGRRRTRKGRKGRKTRRAHRKH